MLEGVKESVTLLLACVFGLNGRSPSLLQEINRFVLIPLHWTLWTAEDANRHYLEHALVGNGQGELCLIAICICMRVVDEAGHFVVMRERG